MTDDHFPMDGSHKNNSLRGFAEYPIIAYYDDDDTARLMTVKMDQQLEAISSTWFASLGSGYANSIGEVPDPPTAVSDGLNKFEVVAAAPSAPISLSNDNAYGWSPSAPAEQSYSSTDITITVEIYGPHISTVRKVYTVGATGYMNTVANWFALFQNSNNIVILAGPNNGNITEVICPYQVLSRNVPYEFGTRSNNVQDGVSTQENYSYDPRTKSIVVTSGSDRNVMI
jgi:hypothetical protein